MKRKLLVAILTLALFATLGTTVVYANHTLPDKTANVSLTGNSFKINGHTYGGNKTVSGNATGIYTWTISNDGKKLHNFVVEDELGSFVPLNGAEAKELIFPKVSGGTTQTATFTLSSSGHTYKVHCEWHEAMGMAFYLVTN